MSDGSISAVAPGGNIWGNKNFIGGGFTIVPETNFIRADKHEAVDVRFGTGFRNDESFISQLKKDGALKTEGEVEYFKKNGIVTLWVNKDCAKEIKDLSSKGYSVNFEYNGKVGGYVP